MSQEEPKRRFPRPWRVDRASKDAFEVKDANGITVAWIYCRDHLHETQFGTYWLHLTSDEARRIANAVARLPELLLKRRSFEARGKGDWRWKASRPYHVALEDLYVRGHWDEIDTLCRFNRIPFDPTGEKIQEGSIWCVYEFEVQLDAIMFWDQFGGRWLRGAEFLYPERPDDLPKMQFPTGWEKMVRQPYRE